MPEPLPIRNLPQTEDEREPSTTVDEAIARVVRRELERMNLVQRLCVDIDECATLLSCSIGTVNNLVAEGKLKAVRFDRRMRFEISDLQELIRRSKK